MPILFALFSLLYFSTTAQTFNIDGYVLLEKNLQAVENQVVEIYDEHGEMLGWFFTNGRGLYSGDFDTFPDSTSYVVVELWRICNDTPIFYSQQIELNQLYLTASFMVCKDQECHAQFNVEQSQLDELEFQFTDVSQGDITNWHWDFGDGNFSTLQNPVHVYQQESHYQVKLTVSGINCNDQRHRGVFAFYRDCLSKFSWEQINQEEEMIVHFMDESIGAAITWNWDFGDGAISDEQNPTHQFNSPGEYEIELTIFQPGCWSSTRNFIRVNPLPQCYAHFVGKQIVSENYEMAFTDISISDSITSWFWNFGDGYESNKQNPVHIYEDPGNYDVSLTINNSNCADTFSRMMKVVGSEDCTANFEITQVDPSIPELVFENLSPADSLLYFWDFGDGVLSNEFSPSHLYDDFGNYNVSLKILGYGCADSIAQLIELLEPLYCKAEFDFEQSFPQSKTVSFINQSMGNEISSVWDFGDGNSSTQPDPQHEYQVAGQYQVQLMITTSDQCTDSVTQLIEILPPLTILGNVWAGEGLLGFGSVLLYKGVVGSEIELYSQAELSDGSFVFAELTPGIYFLQAIPLFDFPFPTIPNYLPTYLQQITKWQEALQINTDNIPDVIHLQLLQYNEFFDGKASLKGSVIQEQKNIDIPLIIYLTDDTDQIRDFRLVEEDNTFEFLNIPYGYYKVYPEKVGKSGQPFSLELNEDYPEMDNLIFIENPELIYPDLTGIDELSNYFLTISPNPASNRISVSFSERLLDSNLKLMIYGQNGLSSAVPVKNMCHADFDISDLPQGVYVLELMNLNVKIHRKLIICH